MASSQRVLEISSGTGQHGVYFATDLPPLGVATDGLGGGVGRHSAVGAGGRTQNLLGPLELDVNQESHWQALGDQGFDTLFTANSLHIMGENDVDQLFFHLDILGDGFQKLIIYGPFKYDGEFTTKSNEEFDQWLKNRDPKSGVRDIEWVCEMAAEAGLVLSEDVSMPANNQLLVFDK